jgi:hydrogenase/urease accessory protein HupE
LGVADVDHLCAAKLTGAAMALVKNGIFPRTVSAWGIPWALVLLFAFEWSACAHNPDSSYVRLEIASARLKSRFTYDLLTLGRIVRLDTDGDHRVTRRELESAAPEIVAYLRESIDLEVSDAEAGLGRLLEFGWPRDSGESIAEKDFHSNDALVTFGFEREWSGIPEKVSLDFRFFERFGERHTVLGTFAVEGAEPAEVAFSQFEPDFVFDTGHEPALGKRLWKFFRLGMSHVLHGVDHLSFLAVLMVAAGMRQWVGLVTAFTVAHTLTLCLAALQWVSLPARGVEVAIALTILWVAVQNLRSMNPAHRWPMTFGFGLIHGFGYAAALQNLSLPEQSFVRCLLSFNVGVEAAQLGLVVLGAPVVWWFRNRGKGRMLQRGVSGCVAVLGAAWVVDRAFGFGWMPF